MNEFQSFFGDVATKKKEVDGDKFFFELAYLCASEFGWSQEDFEGCDLDYLWGLLGAGSVVVKEQNKKVKGKGR